MKSKTIGCGSISTVFSSIVLLCVTIITILSFRVDTIKIRNIAHQGKDTYVMLGLAIQNKNSAKNALLNFLLDLFKLKERVHIRTKINSQKKFLYEN